MENFDFGKKNKTQNEQKRKSASSKVSNFVKSAIFSKLLDKSKLNKTQADNLYANRILEEELIAPNESFSGLIPSLPEGTKIIDVYGSHYANIGDKMYFIRDYKGGFDLVDNTSDFIPEKHFGRRENKRRSFFQKKYGLSTATKATHDDEFYRFDESISDLDNWIIHNDKGVIRKDDRSGKYNTWWRKGKPYKGMEARSLIKDKPTGRHLFAKQSALETSIGRPLDEHRELIGDVIEKGNVQDGGITITPTSEIDLPKIKGLKSFTYNPITKSMERGIFYDPNKPKDEKDQDENLREHMEEIPSNNKRLQDPEIQYEVKKINKDIKEAQKDIEEALKDLEWFINLAKEDREYLIQAEYENKLHEEDSIWAIKNDVPFHSKEELEKIREDIIKQEEYIKKHKDGISELIGMKAGIQHISDEFLELENKFKKLLLEIKPENLQ